MKASTIPHVPKVPTLKHHKASGQAYVRLDGRVVYLGKHDLPETQQKYHQLVAEWLAGGQQLPVASEEITIIELCARFWKHAQSYYRKPNGEPGKELHHFKQAMKPLKKIYGHTKAANFGPLALRAVRDAMVKNGWCRRHVNHNVGRVKRMFRWATENELLPGSVYHALQAVAGLKRGRSSARESDPVKPVPIVHIHAVRPYVSRQVWSMIQLQLYTAARGGEIVRMRPCDIERSGRIWMYTPSEHKTAHYGYERRIYIGPKAQEVLAPFLLRPADTYCFSPVEADTERRAALHAARKTPLSCGNRPGTNRKECPKKQPSDHYTTASYRCAIAQGCDRAFPSPDPLAKRNDKTREQWKRRLTTEQKDELKAWRKAHRWHPHQLRHNAATELRKEFGLEAARIILGHRSAAITEVYAELDQQKAIDAMLKIG